MHIANRFFKLNYQNVLQNNTQNRTQNKTTNPLSYKYNYPTDTVSFGKLSDEQIRARFEAIIKEIYNAKVGSLTIKSLDRKIQDKYGFSYAYQFFTVPSNKPEEKLNSVFPDGYCYKDEKTDEEIIVTYGDLTKKWDKVKSRDKDVLTPEQIEARFEAIIKEIYNVKDGSLTIKSLDRKMQEKYGFGSAYQFFAVPSNNPEEKFKSVFPDGYCYKDEKTGEEIIVTYDDLIKKWKDNIKKRKELLDSILDECLKNNINLRECEAFKNLSVDFKKILMHDYSILEKLKNIKEFKKEYKTDETYLKFYKMDGYDFELAVSKVLKASGKYNNVQITKASGDNGADLILEEENKKVVVQCKHNLSGRPIFDNTIYELLATKEIAKADKMILVASMGISQEAQKVIAKMRSSGFDIEVMTLDDIVKLTKENNVDVENLEDKERNIEEKVIDEKEEINKMLEDIKDEELKQKTQEEIKKQKTIAKKREILAKAIIEDKARQRHLQYQMQMTHSSYLLKRFMPIASLLKI